MEQDLQEAVENMTIEDIERRAREDMRILNINPRTRIFPGDPRHSTPRYSICPHHHLYKQGLVKTVWNPCLRCKFTDIVKKGEITISEPMSSRESAVDAELKRLRRELEFLKRLLLKKR